MVSAQMPIQGELAYATLRARYCKLIARAKHALGGRCWKQRTPGLSLTLPESSNSQAQTNQRQYAIERCGHLSAFVAGGEVDAEEADVGGRCLEGGDREVGKGQPGNNKDNGENGFHN